MDAQDLCPPQTGPWLRKDAGMGGTPVQAAGLVQQISGGGGPAWVSPSHMMASVSSIVKRKKKQGRAQGLGITL